MVDLKNDHIPKLWLFSTHDIILLLPAANHLTYYYNDHRPNRLLRTIYIFRMQILPTLHTKLVLIESSPHSKTILNVYRMCTERVQNNVH